MKRTVWCLMILMLLSGMLIAGSAYSQEVIKIGHLRPLTGNLAMTSDLMIKGFDLAFEQVNYLVAGKKIQIIIGDTKGDVQTTIDSARKMVENDKVAMIVGSTIIAENAALANYINQVGIPQIITTQLPLEVYLTNKWAVGVGGTSAQLTSAMGAYAYDKLGYRKLDIMTQDTASGRAYLAPFISTFKAKGGQIVQEQYTRFPCPDFAPYFTTLKDADALAAWTNGADAIKFLTQYHEMGVDKRLPLVGAYHGSFLAPFTLGALPPADAEARVGDYVATPYSPLFDSSANKQFITAIQSKMKLVPDDTQSAAYQAGMIIIEALKATKGDTTPAKLRQAMLATKLEGPQGVMQFDPQTGISIKTTYICKIAKSADGKGYVWQPVFTYKDVPPKGL
jgi:branched-chain amino acid transport system substrate-binding protein